MSGNILFLVCKPCEEAERSAADSTNDYGVKLAGRTHRGYYEHMVPSKQFDAWLMKHRACGGRTNPDHFCLAMLSPANHDQKDLETAVKLAVVQ